MKYDKLIRDNIPAIIEAAGKTATIETMNEADYRAALLSKLVEEANEVRDATPEELATELADVLEVFDAILAAFEIDQEAVWKIQFERRAARGGFEKRLRLLRVEEKQDVARDLKAFDELVDLGARLTEGTAPLVDFKSESA
ncbi:putative house-cleaning noncanonical NTP pyrophosphatase, all-alpha NTP-PPase (MazG) superfamily [Abditibacterium utsteinense]|uniref:Putative house-cleaning noncanonical NTP pyrophosphatase, all-alpha NTP-PPase (MazG) superfamily n=1 Tax=Abditibacterium utsteinense TaxID=1960156 RepID=A0A2S8SWY3_9BACT|nr:nucleoside triphosphate pyrophosphohydrolase [Abditibacterium utsteinense]PQV65269.1 putative house-cleaning noncanonical NTP pyrophosphatase, all-alpha NTP-PPase (MazG) superfamily [Abditibacterium utsteinense]